MLKVLKILFLTMAMCLCACGATAKNLVVERAIFEDVTAAMSLDQVKGAAFEPAPEVIFEGFSHSAFWVRLRVAAPANGGPLSVRIRPTLLDSATLYYPGPSAGAPGKVLDVSARSAQRDTRIELQPGLNTLYIRAKSVGAMLIKAQVVSPVLAVEQDLRDFLELGAILALYVLLSLVMVGLMILRWDTLLMFFVVHLLVSLVSYILVFGFLDTYSVQNCPHVKTASRLTVITNFLTASLLMQSFLGYLGMRRLQRWIQFAATAFLFLLVLFFVAKRSLILNISTVLGALISFAHLAILFFLCLRFSKNKSIPLAYRFIGLFFVSLFTVVVSRTMLQALSAIEGGSSLLLSPAWRGVLFTLMLLSFLWHRERLQKCVLAQSQIDIAMARAEVKEKNLRVVMQSQFMAMLMHEIKTPLSTIQVAAASLKRRMAAINPDSNRLDSISRAADDINFIIDRCMQVDQLEHGDLPVNKTLVSLKALLSEVQHINGYERVTFSGIAEATVVTDYQYARIILINLITNALKYSPPQSTVELNVHEIQLMTGPGLTLRVTNAVSSAGRPDPLKVFTRYYRAEGAKKEAGSGLGLWLANSLTIKLGSALGCMSDEKQVHFYFSLEVI